MNLTLIIPVYNEEQGLQALFDRLYPALDKLGKSYEIVFINDGSRDRTWHVLQELKAEVPTLAPVRNTGLNGLLCQWRRSRERTTPP